MIPKDGRSFYFEEPRDIKEPAALIWSEARRGEGCEGGCVVVRPTAGRGLFPYLWN